MTLTIFGHRLQAVDEHLQDHLKVAGSSPASGSIPESLNRECSIFSVLDVGIFVVVVEWHGDARRDEIEKFWGDGLCIGTKNDWHD